MLIGRRELSLEAAVSEEPAEAAVLEDRLLLHPKVANESLATCVHALGEVFGERRHLAPERKDKGEGLFERQERDHKRFDELWRCDWEEKRPAERSQRQ